MLIVRDKIYNIGRFTFVNFTLLSEAQIKQVWNWRNNPDVNKYMYNTEFIPYDSHVQFILSLRNRKDCYYWLVKKDDISIGVFNVTSIDLELNMAEIGFYQNPDVCGIGFYLLQQCYNFYFNQLLFERMYASVDVGNYESLILSKYFGCVFEISKELIINGVNRKFLVSENLTRYIYNSKEYSLKNFVNYVRYGTESIRNY